MTSIEGSPSRKRNHEAFEDVAARKKQCSESANLLVMLEEQEQRERKRQRDQDQEQTTTLPTPPLSSGNKRDASPAASSVSDLTDAGSITPPRGLSPVNSTEIPTAFAAMDGHGAPPAKKPKLSFQEKELKRINKEIKEREKAEEKARKDAEKKATADEKARKEADKEAERKKKEAEKEEKRAAQEAEKAAKEEKRRKKEEEKQKKEDEKRKKERSQLKLGNFFAIPVSSNRSRTNSVECPSRTSMSPAPQNLMSTLAASAANPAATTPSKPRKTPYEDLFPNFYKKDGVTLAPINRFQRDEEAIEVLHKTIDRHLLGGLTTDTQQAFDAASLFHLEPSRDLRPRGRHYMPVREIMNEFNPGCSSQMAIDLTTTDSQNTQIKRTTELLRKIPMKILHFREDVRPPYTGTYTRRPVTGTKKLARNPLRRDLPNTDYDYDSEAEWVEDEDGEDIKSDGEDEEDLDDGEDMDGFLDDEGAETMNSRRLVVQGDLEPVSTGLCWEDGMKRSTNIKMADYRMEIILDPTLKSIDPFSTSYWQSPTAKTSMEPPRLPLTAMKNNSATINGLPAGSKSVKPFFSPASHIQTSSVASAQSPKDKDGKSKKLLDAGDLAAFKAALVGSDLSKIGLIEVLKKKFPKHSGAAIKNTLEAVASRGKKGEKEKDKRWVLIDA